MLFNYLVNSKKPLSVVKFRCESKQIHQNPIPGTWIRQTAGGCTVPDERRTNYGKAEPHKWRTEYRGIELYE